MRAFGSGCVVTPTTGARLVGLDVASPTALAEVLRHPAEGTSVLTVKAWMYACTAGKR